MKDFLIRQRKYTGVLFYAIFLFATHDLLPCEINNDIHLINEMVDLQNRHPSEHVLIETNWMDQEKIAVSLGYNCIVAGQLSNEQIRHTAFPFDWCESHIEGLIRCINNDFKDFLSLENLIADRDTRVHDCLYDIRIVHDFPFQRIENFKFDTMKQFYNFNSFGELVKSQYDETYSKLMRRVERFRNLSAFKGEIYFIRSTDITKAQSLELLEALNNSFKDKNFTLIVMNHADEFKTPWNVPKIKNFFIDYKHIFCPFAKGLCTEFFKNSGMI
ncbi:DUF1796 family putative cysteine peptidase [Candidatus Dependentiae bacterium]